MMTKEMMDEAREKMKREHEEFWKARERYEAEMEEEFVRVAMILEDHGYYLVDHVDFDYAGQFFSIEMQDGCRIYHHVFACPKRENFKAVLRWMCGKTKFKAVTAHMKGKKRIPTFYSVKDVDMYYEEYFGDGGRRVVVSVPAGDERYTPSSTCGDYSPSSPWNAPGMSVRDFI